MHGNEKALHSINDSEAEIVTGTKTFTQLNRNHGPVNIRVDIQGLSDITMSQTLDNPAWIGNKKSENI